MICTDITLEKIISEVLTNSEQKSKLSGFLSDSESQSDQESKLSILNAGGDIYDR